MSNQITEVRLLSVPLEKDYKHTLYFKNIADQTNYFVGKTVYNETDFSYQRKEGYIRYPIHADKLLQCNYLMYRNNTNPLFTAKWTYAFITDIEYKNDEISWIRFEIDVIQTYLFNFIVRESFIEREHVNDDTIGKHTFPENLEVGEYKCEKVGLVFELLECSYIMGITEKFSKVNSNNEWTSPIKAPGGKYNGIFSGIEYLHFYDYLPDKISKVINHYAEEGKADAITCLFMYPKALLSLEQLENPFAITELSIKKGEEVKSINKDFEHNETFSYTPENNKLLCFPYNYLLVSNNNGGSAVYHFEKFLNREASFNIKGCLTPGGSIRMTPVNYNGVTLYNQEEGLNLGKFPICNWTSDEYTNWLTQNSVNIGLNIAAGVGQIIGGVVGTVASGGIGTAIGAPNIVSGVSTIANQLAQVHQMSFTPPQAKGNINAGDIITTDGKNTFYFYQMRAKDEYLKIIDNYFKMFGYKCNLLKTPFENHRENFWFTKTIDANIESYLGGSKPDTVKRLLINMGAIPSKDMEKIKSCFNNGITFWSNPEKIGNYSGTNNII